MRRKQAHRVIILSVALINFVLGMGAKFINKTIRIGFIDDIGFWLLILSPVIISLVFVEFLLENKIYKGFRYFWNYWRIKNKLELQMIDANFGIDRGYYVELPKIFLSFNDDISCAVLKISNSLKHENKLDNVVMSSALGKFIVETHYLSDDENFYVYELVDGSVSFKLTFDDFDQFLEYNRKIPPYQIFLDNRTKVNICHTLLVGQTGSGKSYALYNIILQMLNKPVKYQLGKELAKIHNNDDFANLIAHTIIQKFCFKEIDDGVVDCETIYSQLLLDCITNRSFNLKAPSSRNYDLSKSCRYIFFGSGAVSTLYKIKEIFGTDGLSRFISILIEYVLEWKPNDDCRIWLSRNKEDYKSNYPDFDDFSRDNIQSYL